MKISQSLPGPSIDVDELRPVLLTAGTQVIISLIGAVLLLSGALG
jgi:hypothetical protein